MYTKEKFIKALKVKNIFFVALGIILVVPSIAIIVDLIAVYHDQLETVWTAKATPDCIRSIIIGSIMLIQAAISRKCIGDANFYSSYFETDLDGYVTFEELAKVTEKRPFTVRVQLTFFLLCYTKGYAIKNINGRFQVVLNSKKVLCECKNCAAVIEKKEYFTGVCPYCGGSDLFAKVLAGDRFYSIESQVKKGTKRPDFYTVKNIDSKKVILAICTGLAAIAMIISLCMCIDQVQKYFDEDYWLAVLFSGDGPSSFELIRKEIMELIIWSAFLFMAFLPLTVNGIKRFIYASTAHSCADYFARCKYAIIPISWLPAVKYKKNKLRGMKPVRYAIRLRYLRNCTFEMHDNELKMALAKKIVKDKCPTCYGAITGAVDENYRCRYCNNLIMGVLQRK